MKVRSQDLARQVPIELSRVLAGFEAASGKNYLFVKVSEKRKREEFLVVPGSFQAIEQTERKFPTW